MRTKVEWNMAKQNKQRTEAQLRADKARTGRPPKPKSEKMSERVTVHLTPTEKDRLLILAKQEDMTLPALIMKPWRDSEDN
jgi:hypothetical protein